MLTNESANRIEEIVEDLDTNIDTVMKEVDKIDTKIKFQSFGKTKPKSKKPVGDKKREKTQTEKDDAIKLKETEKVERQIERIKSKNQGRAGNVFRIRKDVAGPKKAGQEASSVKDPLTGELLVTRDEIKNATLKYCINNLKGGTPDESVRDIVKQRKEKQLQKLNTHDEDDLVVEEDDFDEVLDKFSKKNTKTYDFLLKAGSKYKTVMFKLCKRVIEKEEIPESFRKTTLYMSWKMKGPMNILKNNRFLHMKNVMARTVDAIVVGKMKETSFNSSSIYQIGGLPGHSIHEHLLTLKTTMAKKEMNNDGVLFLVIDFVSFFDREDIFDCLETLDTINVNKKAKKMWYLLNKDTKIQVKTAHGMTEEGDVGDCLGQGTAGAGLISAANLDQGLQKYFNESYTEDPNETSDVMKYGQVRLQPVAYQDDVGSLCDTVKMARKHAEKLTEMTKEKVLEAHPDKSGIILLGSEKFRRKTEKELKENPIFLTNFKLEILQSTKYLGQSLECNLSRSTLETVLSRSGKIKGAALEVKAIIEDYEMRAVGGLAAAWVLWEKALLPSLLSGAGTWLGKIGESVKLCNQIQSFYWRVICQVPESCPWLGLLCEPGMVDCQFRIWNEKCQLLLRIKMLDNTALVKQVYLQADANNWPGQYNVGKQEIQQAIYEAHHKAMMNPFQNSKKLKDIKEDNFRGMQAYFNYKNLSKSRMKFKIRTKMVENIPGNFKNRFKFNEIGLNCFSCKVEMTQDQCALCPARAELRAGLNMNNIDDVVIYFQRYLTHEKKKL